MAAKLGGILGCPRTAPTVYLVKGMPSFFRKNARKLSTKVQAKIIKFTHFEARYLSR